MAKVVGRLDRTGGITAGSGTYHTVPVSFHLPFTTVVCNVTGTLIATESSWYADTVDTATMAQIVDVTGTPEKVTLTGFLMQSCSGHRWCAVGY